MRKATIAVFDHSVTKNSPAGSCLLQMLSGICKDYQFTVLSDTFDNPAPDLIEWVHVPLPSKPVFLRYILFQLLAPLYYKRHVALEEPILLVLATQGEFVNCDICYAHFCHKAYLSYNWHFTGGRGLRRIARWITHRFNALMEAKALDHAKVIVVPSRGLASELVQTYPKLNGKRIVQIPNPVDIKNFARPEAFDSEPIRKGLGFGFDDLVMVFVALGNFERKGLRLLLEALAALQCPTAKLLVVGGSQSEIREYVSVRDRLGLSASGAFVGFQADVRPYLWSSDLFVFPSAYETFALGAFQAAAAGLPIMATRLHGVEEFLQNGVNGWLVEREVGTLTHMLSQALVERDKLAYMGATARKMVNSKYDVPSFLSCWQSLLDSLA